MNKEAFELLRIIHSINSENVDKIHAEQIKDDSLLLKFLPEFKDCIGLEQNKHHLYTVDKHIFQTIALVPKIATTKVAALLHDVGKPRSLTIDEAGKRQFLMHELESVKIAKDFFVRVQGPEGYVFDHWKNFDEYVIELVEHHMFSTIGGRKSARRIISKLRLDNVKNLIYLKIADRKAGHVCAPNFWTEEWPTFEKFLWEELDNFGVPTNNQKKRDLEINGDDVMRIFDIKKGCKEVGEILQEVMYFAEDNPDFKSRHFLLAKLEDIKFKRGQ